MTVETGLFVFHRDFRIPDNVGLFEMNKLCKKLYVCFVFTPQQVGDQNTYKSDNSVQLMIESLVELSDVIALTGGRLIVLHGDYIQQIHRLVKSLQIECVGFNRDYTPYAINRTKLMDEYCQANSIECKLYEDYYLYQPGTVLTGAGTGTAFKKYTPFYDEVIDRPVNKITSGRSVKLAHTDPLSYEITLKTALSRFTSVNTEILVHGGRKLAIGKLKEACKKQDDYDEQRDFFTTKTTRLSAYIKFGCVSIREVYHAFVGKFGLNHGLIRELLWREFFAHVLYAYPQVVGSSYQRQYKSIRWVNNKSAFGKWQDGKTGFPLVDACMRELNTTGYMHNRGRMVVASFLIKTLLIDWRWGEKYFAQKLTDYDIASNNGNWQGISGTGVDMKPYFRDMNPWIQSAKYDKDAEYIKYWVPELSTVDPADIHKWSESYQMAEYQNVKYPSPIANYSVQKEKMLAMYKNAAREHRL
jgi:deoxyribodipyrimidine photo-lyase